MARLKGVEEMRNSCLGGLYGKDKTPDLALESLIEDLRGKRIAIDALSDSRREFKVPMTLNHIR